MNLLSKAVTVVRRSLSLSSASDAAIIAGTTTVAGLPVTSASVLGLSTAWACINLLSGTIASLPVAVYRPDRQGVAQKDTQHPLHRILHDSPNRQQTALDFWEEMNNALELRGNAYALKGVIGDKLVALTPIRPEIVSVKKDDTGDLRYQWSEDGKSYDKHQSEMLHIRGFGGNPMGGLSTLAYGRATFGLAQAENSAASNTFANGLRPSGLLLFKRWLNKEQRAVAENELVAKFSGTLNAGKPMVLEGDTDYRTITMNPEDAQMLQSRGFSVEEVCRMFGVPPFLIGHTEKVTSFGSGLEQQVLGFVKFALRRRLKRIELALEKQLLTAADLAAGIYIRFNIEGLLRGSSAERSAFYNVMLASGVMTINEVRALESLAPVPGGDIPRMQMQNVPITEARGHQPVATE